MRAGSARAAGQFENRVNPRCGETVAPLRLSCASPAAAPRTERKSLTARIRLHRRELGITLPAPGTPKANYTIACWESPTLLYVSGHLPIK